MTSITDVSSALGEYMLKGWVLTDQSCPTPGCTVPLMRSPKGKTPTTYFCANCDGNPASAHPSFTVDRPSVSSLASSAGTSTASHFSRSSTPPTEVSDALSSPVFAPPPETEQSRRRREQSDRASTEIGKRLLKGWAMLGDECPNPGCFGVPLVRPPKAGGEKDPRKECVICGTIYISEVDWAGRERLVVVQTDNIPLNSDATDARTSDTPNKGKTAEVLVPSIPSSEIPTTSLQTMTDDTRSIIPQTRLSRLSEPSQGSSALPVLEESAQALQQSLRALSARLTSLSSTPSLMNPSSIGITADAISKVTQAFSQVRQVQWCENEANAST